MRNPFFPISQKSVYFGKAKPLMRSLLLLACLAPAALVAQEKGYYRTPSIYQKTVVFTAEGDLWKYDMTNGVTTRITTNPGLETNPAISPDGRKIAFEAEYEGSSEVYEMDINGGVPKRLTYDFAGRNLGISGWTRDGKILYRTSRYSALPSSRLATVDPATGVSEPLPLWQASEGCYDPGGVLFFTRLEDQGSKTKRYKGGFIQQIWKFDGKQEAVCLTSDFDGTSTNPMLYQDRVYFLSDRDGTINLWSMDKDGKNLKQHTFSKAWDLQTASIYETSIVYQKGADLWLYDIGSNTEKMLDIRLTSDFDQRKPKWIKSNPGSITYSDLSPNGNYAAIISRGRLFVSPSKGDRWVEVNRRSGIRYREVHFINDKSLAVLSDESGENEIWRINADGSDTARQLTHDSRVMLQTFAVSPDGRYIASNDKNDALRVIDAGSGAIKFEYTASYAGNGELTWSPDSRFLNFTRGIENQNSQVCVLDVQGWKMTPLTTTRLNSSTPTWSADHKWLYFISERNLHSLVQSPWGPRQPEPFYTETQNIYAMPLDSLGKFPFTPVDSWLSDSVFNPAPAEDKHAKKDRPIDWAYAMRTLYQVPVKSANLGGLDAADGFLYYLDLGPAGNRGGGKLFALKMQESKTYEPIEVASGVSGYTLSANKKRLLITFSNRNLALADANGQKVDVEKSALELSNWNFVVDPRAEWKEMYADAWRMMRDYFYDRDLHKVDWAGVRQRYAPLLDRLTDRYELDDLIGQMVGELSTLHTFVAGGDKRQAPDQVPVGFLGALLKKDPKGLRIEHIYQSDPDYPNFSSPLNKPELHIREGDIITAVNNVRLSDVSDISELLANKVGVPVKLSLLDAGAKPYDQVVRPFSPGSDESLRYAEWELTRREKTDSLGKEQIGYVHLRAMGGGDMDDFVKQFYPVFNRQGLIIDVRHNFGGNIDSWVLEKLLRKAWMYWQGRYGGPAWNMPFAFRGHVVILCDQMTCSDGEAIAEGFRRLGLGKVIGMRTWGGEVWLSFDNTLVDNGIASAAETGVYGPEQKWLIEGRGVEPDFVVDNLPFETYKGKDAQLEYAIDYLTKQIAKEPVPIAPAPPHPDKSFKY
jgi:tricorn protease